MAKLAGKQTTVGEKLTLAVASLWTIAVWSLFGAAIARFVAARLVHQQPISAAKALVAAWSHWPATAMAPVGVWGAIVLLSSLAAACRWLLQLDVLLLAAGVVWPMALLFGLTFLFLLGGATLGWPLMTTSGAIEQGDAFDQVGRAFAYLYQRPLQLVALVAMATALGILCETALWGVVEGTVRTTHSMLLRGRQIAGAETWGMGAVRFWQAAIYRLAESFALAYLASAAVAIYLMLRRAIDDVEIDE